MKFNKLAVVMNAPYQQADGGHSRSALPLYHRFIEKVVDEIQPDYLVSIHPSRWMTGGRGLDKFRQRMMNDKRIRKTVHFKNAKDVFPDVEIPGGVSYFLWDKSFNGDCEFNGVNRDLAEFAKFDLVVSDNQAVPILRKVLAICSKFVSEGCLAKLPFGLRTNFSKWRKTGVKCYAIGGKEYFCDPADFVDNHGFINKWKVATSKADGAAQLEDKNGARRVLSRMMLLEPGAICTETYHVTSGFDTKTEAENFITYMKSKFFRFMLGIRLVTQDINKEKYKWVPDLQNYSHPWTDAELYEKFGLNKQERAYIESKIKEIK